MLAGVRNEECSQKREENGVGMNLKVNKEETGKLPLGQLLQNLESVWQSILIVPYKRVRTAESY